MTDPMEEDNPMTDPMDTLAALDVCDAALHGDQRSMTELIVAALGDGVTQEHVEVVAGFAGLVLLVARGWAKHADRPVAEVMAHLRAQLVPQLAAGEVPEPDPTAVEPAAPAEGVVPSPPTVAPGDGGRAAVAFLTAHVGGDPVAGVCRGG